MTSKINTLLNIYQANPVAATNNNPSTCHIEIHILYRFQIKIPSNEGVTIVIEDFVLPEILASFRVPIISPLSMWCELYLEDVLKNLNLDACVLNSIKPKFAEAAVSLAQRNGNKGFTMVVELGILKAECLAKDEVHRITSELIKIEPSSKIA